MYASVHLEKFAHEVDHFLRLVSNSSSFHNKIILMTMCGGVAFNKMRAVLLIVTLQMT